MIGMMKVKPLIRRGRCLICVLTFPSAIAFRNTEAVVGEHAVGNTCCGRRLKLRRYRRHRRLQRFSNWYRILRCWRMGESIAKSRRSSGLIMSKVMLPMLLRLGAVSCKVTGLTTVVAIALLAISSFRSSLVLTELVQDGRALGTSMGRQCISRKIIVRERMMVFLNLLSFLLEVSHVVPSISASRFAGPSPPTASGLEVFSSQQMVHLVLGHGSTHHVVPPFFRVGPTIIGRGT